jgi:hypothetical protein
MSHLSVDDGQGKCRVVGVSETDVAFSMAKIMFTDAFMVAAKLNWIELSCRI